MNSITVRNIQALPALVKALERKKPTTVIIRVGGGIFGHLHRSAKPYTRALTKISKYDCVNTLYLEDGNVAPAIGLCTNLTKLVVNQSVRSLAPFNPLKNLVHLELTDFRGATFEPIASLVNLRRVKITGYPCRPVISLSAFGKLSKLALLELDLRRPLLKRLIQLKNWGDGWSIWSQQAMTHVDALANATRLQRLSITGGRIEPKNLNWAAPLAMLHSLQLRAAGDVSSVAPLSGLTRLTSLDLYCSKLDSLKPLKKLPLKSLDLSLTTVRKNFCRKDLPQTLEKLTFGDLNKNTKMLDVMRALSEEVSRKLDTLWVDENYWSDDDDDYSI